MHKLGCQANNNIYGNCSCSEIEMREHTEQLRIYNENYYKNELITKLENEQYQLIEENHRLKAKIDELKEWIAEIK
jgi:cell division septum initiation protein DivIVA